MGYSKTFPCYSTPSQKAIVGVAYKKYYAEFAKQNMVLGAKGMAPVPNPIVSRDKAGDVVGVSGKMIDMAEVVQKEGYSTISILTFDFNKIKRANELMFILATCDFFFMDSSSSLDSFILIS